MSIGRPIVDRTGQRFGRLLVLGLARVENQNTPRSVTIWRVKCDCGRELEVRRSNLINAKSCGCAQLENMTKHGHARKRNQTREYVAWVGMKQRCDNPSDHKFADYGGRGITICERWRGSFESFLQDMGPKPSPKHSIDRIDVNGNYEPGNCRWATPSQQQQNQRRSKLTESDVETIRSLRAEGMTLKAIAARFGVSFAMISHICRGRAWSDVTGLAVASRSSR